MVSNSVPTDFLEVLAAQLAGAQCFPLISFLKTLRDSHPDYVVSKLDKTSFDLLGYATAGHAHASMDGASDYMTDLHYSREPLSNARRLKDNILFAKLKYTWNDTNYFLFVLSPEDIRDRVEYHFLLTPRGDRTYDGVHPKTQELLNAVGRWTAETNKKTLDFNSEKGGPRSYLDAAHVTWETMPSSSWDDIIMKASAKSALKKDVSSFFTSRGFFKDFNLPWKRGIIFHGPSGTGKTTIMKTLMTTLAEGDDLVPNIYVNFTNQHDLFPSTIHDIFSRARQQAPCLLVLEDLDSFMSEDSRGTFLNELDNGSNDGILILGSARNIQELDPAIRDRPGRFDTKYECKLPGHDERVAFANQWKAKLDDHQLVRLPKEACDFIAKLTDGFSYTYLKELFSSLLFFYQNASIEDRATHSEPAAAEEKESSPLSTRQKDLADIATPESLRDNRVVKFIRQQVIVLLHEMELSDTASKKACRRCRGQFIGREEACPGCTADENDDFQLATSSRSFSRIEFIASTPDPSSVEVLDNDEDACPGCTRQLKDTVKAENDPDACPGCTRRAANLAVAQAPVSADACPGCTRKAADSSDVKEAESSDAAAVKDLDSPDACPGCTRKEKAAASQSASEDACPGCTKKLAVADDVSGDACPGCTKKLVSTASVSDEATRISPDACPGCTRKISEAAKLDGEQNDDALLKACPGCTKKTADATKITSEDTNLSTDACPGCTRKTADATKLTSEDTDLSTDACPGCTRKKTSEAAQMSEEDAGASTDACPGCTRTKAAETLTASENDPDVSTDACPGCTRKNMVGAATADEDAGDASTDACPGCTKKETAVTAVASEDDGDAGTDACPGCTRKMATSTASLNTDDTDVSPDACPGCTRKTASDAANLNKESTDVSAQAPATATETEAVKDDDESTDACPGCTRKEAANKVSQGSEQTDTTLGTEACPGCT